MAVCFGSGRNVTLCTVGQWAADKRVTHRAETNDNRGRALVVFGGEKLRSRAGNDNIKK